jgi:3-phenylpropionate/trans-cinnamate dioxygenase ferredoxin subunit
VKKVADKTNLVHTLKADEIPAGTMKRLVLGGMDVLVVNYQGSYYAVQANCTHMGGDLSKGTLEGEVVVCPRHGARFDVTTGKCVKGPKVAFLKLRAQDLATYDVKVEGERILVRV